MCRLVVENKDHVGLLLKCDKIQNYIGGLMSAAPKRCRSPLSRLYFPASGVERSALPLYGQGRGQVFLRKGECRIRWYRECGGRVSGKRESADTGGEKGR